MLAIVLDLKIFVFSITIFDLITRSALVKFFLLRVRYLYKLTGLRFYILGLLPDLQVFVIAIVTGECNVLLLRKYGYKACAVLFGF